MMTTNDASKNNTTDNNGLLAGHKVNRIGFGAMQLPGPRVWGPPKDKKAAIAVLKTAIQLGVNHIDTAQYYGPDVSNQLIKEALHPYAPDLVLVTKIGAQRDNTGGWVPAQRPEELIAGVEDNLRCLQIDRISVVNLRMMPSVPGGGPVPQNQQVLLDDQIAAMIQLRDAGKIEGFGISNASLEQVQKALPAKIACVQNAYSLLNREDEPILQLCLDHHIAWVPFFPLGSAGFPGISQVTKHPLVISIARDLEVTPAQIGLSWLLHHAPNLLLIPGTSSTAHLKENMEAANIRLHENTLLSLDQLTEKKA
ncbi:oxidoreductase [Arachidicoccus rhizosphaerae]|nr:oxidoreductase [Arachidicoccus rhizosphaerae]